MYKVLLSYGGVRGELGVEYKNKILVPDLKMFAV